MADLIFFYQILVYVKSRFTQIMIHGYVQDLNRKYTYTLRRNNFESESIDVAKKLPCIDFY